MNPRRAADPVISLSRRLAAAYCIACALIFVISLASVWGVWQTRSTAEAEAACSNILSLVLDEVASSQSSDLESLRTFLDRPAFSAASIRISDDAGFLLESGAKGAGGTDLGTKAETQDGKRVNVEVSYSSTSLIAPETLPVLMVGVVLVAMLVLISCRWFVRAAVKPVERALRRQREFVAAASHELRSPLSVIKLDLGAAKVKAKKENAVATHALIEEAEVECGNLSLLADDLLALATGAAQGWDVDCRPCDAETIFVEAFDGMDEKATLAGITLVPTLPNFPLPLIRADDRRVVQVLRILLENALSYSAAGQDVRLSLRRESHFAVFAVADRGPGIADEDKLRVFDRFYQTDQSRGEASHHGLGLSIAREIVDAHKGQLTVSDNEGGGTVFEVFIPLVEESIRTS